MSGSLPDVFLGDQQRLLAAVYAHPVTVVEKSRRTGFSWAMGGISVLIAGATRAAGGMDVLYMGYDKEMAREFIDYVAEWGKQLQRAVLEVEEFVYADPDKPEEGINAFRIRFASGFEVIALPSVARALRGKQGLVIIDEAAFHSDLPGVLKAAMALLMWGGRVVVISTHDGETNPFNELVNDIRAGRKPYHLMRVTLDDALADGLYQRICLVTGGEWSAESERAWRAQLVKQYGDNADEELFVIPNPTSGAFIPLVLIEARQDSAIPVLRWDADADFNRASEQARRAECAAWCRDKLMPVLDKLSPNRRHVFGMDVARRGDLTVIWVSALLDDRSRPCVLVIELRNMPFTNQRQVLWYVIDGLPRFAGGAIDATGLGMDTAEQTAAKYGECVLQVMLSEPWYREHMPRWKAAFEDGLITIPRDEAVVGDIRSVKLVRGVARVPLPTKDDLQKRRHGDAAIASVLAYTASHGELAVYEFEPVPLSALARAASGNRAWRERAETDDDLPPATRSIVPERRGGAWAG